MADFLTEEDCIPNINTALVAGKVLKVEPLKGKTVGLTCIVGFMKHWPSGGSQEIPIRCYISGADRVEKLSWLKAGEVVLISGEITDKGSVYAHRLEQLSKPDRVPGEDDDAYLAGMQKSQYNKVRR